MLTLLSPRIRALLWIGLVCAALAPQKVRLVELTNVSWKQGRPLPSKIRKLDGQRVWTVGYMHATDDMGMEEFSLVATLQCQCGGSPTPDKFVKVVLEEGTTDFRPDPVAVIGTLEVGEEEEEGFVTSIYRLRGRILK